MVQLVFVPETGTGIFCKTEASLFTILCLNGQLHFYLFFYRHVWPAGPKCPAAADAGTAETDVTRR